MTRQEQNEIILSAIQKQLEDKPDVKDAIADKYQQWVLSLIDIGQQQMSAVASKQQGGQNVQGNGPERGQPQNAAA